MLWYLAAMPVIYRNRVKHDDLHVRTDEMSTSHPWHGGFIFHPGTLHIVEILPPISQLTILISRGMAQARGGRTELCHASRF